MTRKKSSQTQALVAAWLPLVQAPAEDRARHAAHLAAQIWTRLRGRYPL